MPTGAANIFNEDDLIEVLENLPDNQNTVIYVPKAVKIQMNIAFKNRNPNFGTGTDGWGKPVMTFQDVPVRRLDQIVPTEAVVS